MELPPRPSLIRSSLFVLRQLFALQANLSWWDLQHLLPFATPAFHAVIALGKKHRKAWLSTSFIKFFSVVSVQACSHLGAIRRQYAAAATVPQLWASDKNVGYSDPRNAHTSEREKMNMC